MAPALVRRSVARVLALQSAVARVFAGTAIALAACIGLLAGSAARGAEPVIGVAPPSTLTYEQVQDFGPYTAMGFYMAPTMMVGRDGNVWGSAGEKVFRIDPTGTLSIVYTASGPVSRFVVGNDGFLYGFTWQSNVTYGGGGSNAEFFRLDYQGNYTQVLVLPVAIATDIVVGSDGAFYGGPAEECFEEGCHLVASMIKITSAGAYTFIAGHYPYLTPKVVGSDGALYGVNYQQWGVASTASIFRLDTAGTFTTIHQMTQAEGFFSNNLMLGSDAMLYGTSQYSDSGYGSLVRLDNMGTVGLLHPFDVAEGAYPTGALAVGGDGAVYGVTEYGGPAGAGSVYRVDPAGTFTTVHSFNGTDGFPNQGLLLAKDGALYGVTQGGASPVAFRIDTAGTVTYPVFAGHSGPHSPLIQGSDCGLYGVSLTSSNGIVYRIFEPGHLCQRIEFDPIPDRVVGDLPFTVTATASSGLPVSFSASGRCTLSGDQVRLKRGVGMCRVTALQTGDSRFEPAAEVTQEFRVWPRGG